MDGSSDHHGVRFLSWDVDCVELNVESFESLMVGNV
jgi:hypothetical protein